MFEGLKRVSVGTVTPETLKAVQKADEVSKNFRKKVKKRTGELKKLAEAKVLEEFEQEADENQVIMNEAWEKVYKDLGITDPKEQEKQYRVNAETHKVHRIDPE